MVHSVLLLASLAHASECPTLAAQLLAVDSSERCLTMPLRQAWIRAREVGAEDCLTAALEARGLPSAAMPLAPPSTPSSFQPDKIVRDTYDLPNSEQSENFVMWWGDGSGVADNNVDDLLEAFEEGWVHLVDTMVLPQPDSADVYKFNLYVGDSGSGAPSVYGNAGYFWYDSDGYPMIVLSLGTLSDPEYGKTTAVHELFHAVQAATGNYASSTGSWLWEASSSWVEGEIYPELPYYAAFLFGFAFLPHLPLDHYDYPDSGALEEYHQYGAFIFPRYLSEIAFDWTVVRDAWTQGSPTGDPIQVFGSLFADLGADFNTVWADFAAHNATWDYQDGADYSSILNMYDNYYQDYGVAASYANEGTRDWVTPTQRLPQRFGVHYIELRYPNDGTLHVELELDSQGSQGSLAEWPVTLVRVDGEPIYEPLTVQDGSIAYSLEGVGDETAIWLVVGATAQQRRSDETFGYSYRMWVDSEALDSEPADDTGDGEGEKPGGCGCLSGGAMGGAWLGLVALAVVRRRRS